MAKTYSLSLPDDEAQRLELEAEQKGTSAQQFMRQLIRDRHSTPVPLVPASSPDLEQLSDQMQHIQEQLDTVQHWLQQDRTEPLQPEPLIRNAMQPVSHRVQQMEMQIVNLCEALEKLTGVLESDRALLPRVIKRQEGFLEAVYVLVEKVLLYTSPAELTTANQRLVEEMHTQLEKFLEE
jgi:hypothetical protein